MSAKRVKDKPGGGTLRQDNPSVVDPQLQEFGAQLRDARKQARLTIRDVAKLTGIDKTDVSKIERGLINPSYTRIQKLALSVNMSIELLPQSEAKPRKKI